MKSLLKYVAAIALCAGLMAPDALALDAVPHSINIQGVLRNVGGEVVTGTYSIKFALYDDAVAGFVLCQNITSVTVTGGVFNTNVNCPTTAFVNKTNVYLGIQVGADAELARVQLASVGFAIQAEHAEQADELLGAATDVNCVGCIGESEVSFNYAASDRKGGPATDVACLNCVSGGSTGDIGLGTITSDNIGTGQVQAGNLANGAVTNAKLGADAVKTGNIEDGQVTTNDLAGGAVTSAKIASGAVGDSQLGVNYALGDAKGGAATNLNCSSACVSSAEAGFNYAAGETKGGAATGLNCLASPCVEAGEVLFSYAAGATKGGAALDLACTDCVGSGEVQFNYAGSTAEGGPASDVACTTCIAQEEVAFNYAASATKGGDASGLACTGTCVSSSEVDFNWAASASKGGPANGLVCTGCVASEDIEDGSVVNADISGPVTGSKITTATATDLGVVKIGSGISISNGSIAPDYNYVAQKDHEHSGYFRNSLDNLEIGDQKYIRFQDPGDSPGSYEGRLSESTAGGDSGIGVRLSLGVGGVASKSFFEITAEGSQTGQKHVFDAGGNARHFGNLQFDGDLTCKGTGCIGSAHIINESISSNDILNGTITGSDLASDLQLTTSGKVTAGEVWASKFVDSADAGGSWFADPSGTSTMNGIQFVDLKFKDNNVYGMKKNAGGTVSTYSSSLDAGSTGETLYVAKNTCGPIDVFTACNNTMTVHGTLKAKVMWDEDGGTYYVDPGSHSILNTLKTATSELPRTGTSTNYITGTTYAFDSPWMDGSGGSWQVDPSGDTILNMTYSNGIRLATSWPGDPANGYAQIANSGHNLYLNPDAKGGGHWIFMRDDGSDRIGFNLNGEVNAGLPTFRTNGGYLVINSGSSDKRLLLNWDQTGGTTEVVGTFKTPAVTDSLSPTCIMDAGNTSTAYEIYSQYIAGYYFHVYSGLRVDGTGIFVVGNGDWGTGIRMYGNTSIIPNSDAQGAVGMAAKRFAFMYSVNSVWTSERSRKKDIRYLNKTDMDTIGAAIQQIKPATWYYNEETPQAGADDSVDKMMVRNVPHIGAILDEMPAIITNGGQGWYANDSVGFLLVATRYLDDKINRQAGQIRDLEDRIAVLEQVLVDAGLYK